MGDLIAVDFRNKRKKPEPEQPEELVRLAKEVMGLATEQPFYESSLGYVAPLDDPA